MIILSTELSKNTFELNKVKKTSIKKELDVPWISLDLVIDLTIMHHTGMFEYARISSDLI